MRYAGRRWPPRQRFPGSERGNRASRCHVGHIGTAARRGGRGFESIAVRAQHGCRQTVHARSCVTCCSRGGISLHSPDSTESHGKRRGGGCKPIRSIRVSTSHASPGGGAPGAQTHGNGYADVWQWPRGGAVEVLRVSLCDHSMYVVREYTCAAASRAVVGEAHRCIPPTAQRAAVC